MRRPRRGGLAALPVVAAFVAAAAAAAARAESVEVVRPSAAPPQQVAVLHTITSGGVPRSYRRHVPASARPGAPLPALIMLHGALGDSGQVERWLGLSAVAEREGFVAVLPQGLAGAWNDGRPPELRYRAARDAKADDALFLRDLARHLVDEGIAAPGRLFLGGVSNGGFMAARMACEAAEVFAGVAILIASVPRSYEEGCRPARPIPVFILNGTEDRLVPLEGYVPTGQPRDGALGIMSAADHARFWAARNGCRGASETRLNDVDPGDGSTIARRDWEGCAPGGAVTHYTVEGGGHQTPTLRGGLMDHVVAAFLGPRNRDAETAELVWSFFARSAR